MVERVVITVSVANDLTLFYLGKCGQRRHSNSCRKMSLSSKNNPHASPRSKLTVLFLILSVIYGIFSLKGVGLYLHHICTASKPFLYADYFYVPLLSMTATPLLLVTVVFLLRLIPRGSTGLFWTAGLLVLVSTALSLVTAFTPGRKELMGSFASSVYFVLLLCVFLYWLLTGRTRRLASFELAVRQPILTANHFAAYICYVVFMFYSGFAILGYIVSSGVVLFQSSSILLHLIISLGQLCIMIIIIMQPTWIVGLFRAWQRTKAHLLMARGLLGITDIQQPVTLSNFLVRRLLLVSCNALALLILFAINFYFTVNTIFSPYLELSSVFMFIWLSSYYSAWEQVIRKPVHSPVNVFDWFLPQTLFVSIVWLLLNATHYACHRLVYDILEHDKVWTPLTFELTVVAGVAVSAAWLDDVFSYPIIAHEMHAFDSEAFRKFAPKELAEQLDTEKR